MFPEHRELISRLKTEDAHFHSLFEKHHAIDHKVQNMETRVVSGTHEEIEELKKQKLHLKDQLYAIILKATGKA